MNASLQIEDLAPLAVDPLAFVLWAFPWGEADTELANEIGPDPWQVWALSQIRDWIAAGASWEEAFRLAVASGHGIGKSALVCWIILWAFSTQPNCRGVVTANTENQLRTKTWAELAKWFRLFLAREFFELQSTKLCSRDPEYVDTWRIDRVTWSEDNTEAFAGLHNKGSRLLVIFDEASAIAEKVWEVTNGALTDSATQILWIVFGNPTRNSGGFFECFHSRAHRWRNRRVDSRTVRITNKREISAWVADYGLDSDYVRVRVLGQFPNSSSLEFIGRALIEGAQSRWVDADPWAPLVLGVDVARQGEDSSVLFFRRGLDAKSIPPIVVRETNLMTLAGIVAQKAVEHRVDGIFVDEGGIGAGVVDRLRQLRVNVFGIQFGSRADLPPRESDGAYANKRSEMYGSVRRWLAQGAIPDDPKLLAELNGPLYAVKDPGDTIALERKRDMKKRLPEVGSPDRADALALTFAYPVAPQNRGLVPDPSKLITIDYDPLELAEAM